MASLPFVKRNKTHFRFAELGFFGFLMRVLSTIPRSCGFPSKCPFFLGFAFGLGPDLCMAAREAMLLQHRLVLLSIDSENKCLGLVTMDEKCLTWLSEITA